MYQRGCFLWKLPKSLCCFLSQEVAYTRRMGMEAPELILGSEMALISWWENTGRTHHQTLPPPPPP